MFDEHNESPTENPLDPKDRAKDKSDEFRMHAELAAVFEAVRKFDAQIIPGLNPDVAREIQRSMAKLEKNKLPDTPVVSDEFSAEARNVLSAFKKHELSTNDYHIHRRPGEVMMIRWLAGDEVDLFYKRLQAHFDAALEGFKEDERQALEWKKDSATPAYLEALNAIEVKMAERYLREIIREHRIFVLSTQAVDEMNVVYLADYIMGVSPAEIVGEKSAPPDEPTENDLAWFFKLFSLRGISEGVEQMCFFTFMQKSDDGDLE
jgi:hypothetical protein